MLNYLTGYSFPDAIFFVQLLPPIERLDVDYGGLPLPHYQVSVVINVNSSSCILPEAHYKESLDLVKFVYRVEGQVYVRLVTETTKRAEAVRGTRKFDGPLGRAQV